MSTEIIVISDLHCGHVAGLLPLSLVREKFQKSLSTAFSAIARKYRGIEHLIVNGDVIEGQATKDNGRDIIETDRQKQVENIAIPCINLFNAKNIYITEGTGYHSSHNQEHSYEEYLSKILPRSKFSIYFEALEIGGKIFNVRHHISGGGSNPGNALTREINSIKLNYADAKMTKPDVVIRSHLHKYIHNRDCSIQGIITPSLQLFSAFGSRRCSGPLPDVGIVHIKIERGVILCQETLWKVRELTTR